jgi:DNA-binding LacI/PurR family transcriptional regulator
MSKPNHNHTVIGGSKAPTMKTVAELAGVSVQTVSAVINGDDRITPETAARVRAAVKQLNYRPYSVARSLRTRRTKTIALVVSDIANPVFASMASTAEDQAHAHGYSMVVYNTRDDLEREESYMRTAADRWVDGVIFVSAQDRVTSVEMLTSVGIPVVAVDRMPEGYNGPSVTLDNLAAGRMAANHLLALGHRQIAHIAGPLHLRLARERLEGFQSVIGAAPQAAPLRLADAGDWECASGYHAMQTLIAQAPQLTAVFAANDRLAIGAMQAVHQAGLRLPDDISLIGLDDIEVAAYQIPPLTTIRQSFAELASLGVQLLLDLLQGNAVAQTQIVIQPELIKRNSTSEYRPRSGDE